MFEHCLYFNTTSLARQLEREWARAFKPLGLTPPQAFMLRVILEKPSITCTDLSVELNVSKATCSRTVDGLIELGFIKTIQADSDGRRYQLHPTATAQEIHAQIRQTSAQVTKKITQRIGKDNFETTVIQLRNIHASIR